MKAKQYNVFLLTALSIFILINYLVWNLFTIKVLPQDGTVVGDLARLSYNYRIAKERYNINSVEKQHFTFDTNLPKVDLITIGDSFSNGVGGGENRFYQDLIASKFNLNVLNLQMIPGLNPIETVLVLLQTPQFQEIKPKHILLQSVERYSIQRFSSAAAWDVEASDANVESLFAVNYKSEVPKQSFINIANLKVGLNKILYEFDDNAYTSEVYIVDLDKDLFSSTAKSKLSFYYEDIDKVELTNDASVSRLNDNLNELARILNKNNVSLIFMPTVDKLNLYGPHVLQNDYPKSTFFEKLRELNHNYYFVDTKKILWDELKLGAIDIYFSDDTHWSSVGSGLVVDSLESILEKTN